MNVREHLTPLNIILAALLVAATIAGFVLIPEGASLPVHWGITGRADAFLPRDAALLLDPLIAVVALAVLIFARRWGNPDASRSAIGVGISAILGLFLAIETATVMIGVGMAVDMVRVVVLALGVMFVVIGNVLPKTQPNPVAGIRLPWTMHDPVNWQATNRLGGLLMLVGGIAMAAAALLTGASSVLLTITIAVVLLSFLIPTIYSWRLSRRPRAG